MEATVNHRRLEAGEAAPFPFFFFGVFGGVCSVDGGGPDDEGPGGTVQGANPRTLQRSAGGVTRNGERGGIG